MKLLLITLTFLLLTTMTFAQVGIGTSTPDDSSILDLTSSEKGFLLPRLTEVERDLINSPANALMIYNTSVSKIQVNNGTASLPIWADLDSTQNAMIMSVIETEDTSTNSTTHEKVEGMELTPPAGNYLVLFNGQFGLMESVPVNTSQAVIDLGILYAQLMALPATDTSHGAVFGNNEVLFPGVYTVPAAASLASNLTLDGGGDPNAIFVIRTGGALSTGAGTTVDLINGAQACNVFWVSEGALSLAANTIMKGTLIANNAAISAAAGSDLEGRMFSTAGAATMGPGTFYIPAGNSFANFGVLQSFLFFTSAGAVGNTGPSVMTGDVGTNLGAITGFVQDAPAGNILYGNIYGPGAAPAPVNNTLVTFSVFVNDVLIVNSSRTTNVNTSVISLQTIATIAPGEKIDIRWKVDTGGVVIGNRILTLQRAN